MMKPSALKIARHVTGFALALTLATAIAMPVKADEWRDHEWHARHWYMTHPHMVAPVTYAPPVVYAPPPEPVGGINLIVPLNIR